MANNLLYLKDPVSKKKVLLAKGWEAGWQVYKTDTLPNRLQELFDNCRDEGRELGSLFDDNTELILETE